MSAGITIWCDVGNTHGDCPQQITLDTTDLAQARAAAVSAGWQLSPSGDRCALYHAPKPAPRKPRQLR